MMAGGVESWSPSSSSPPPPPEGRGEGKVVVVGGAMVMDFPLDDSGATSFSSSSSSPKLPRRLRRRLSESKSPQNFTVEDIEAKLRHADLRRQVSLSLSLFLVCGS